MVLKTFMEAAAESKLMVAGEPVGLLVALGMVRMSEVSIDKITIRGVFMMAAIANEAPVTTLVAEKQRVVSVAVRLLKDRESEALLQL